MEELTLREISDRIDLQLSKINGSIIKDEYEKSLYLTKAAEIYYTTVLSQFEAVPEVYSKLSRLIKDVSVSPTDAKDFYGGVIINLKGPYKKVLRDEVLLESSTLPYYNGLVVNTLEERLAEIQSSLVNPFRKATEVYIPKVMYGGTDKVTKVVLYPKKGTEVKKYTATVALPLKPFILEDLDSVSLDIEGEEDKITELPFKYDCMLEIIDVAVSLVLKDLGIGGEAQAPPAKE